VQAVRPAFDLRRDQLFAPEQIEDAIRDANRTAKIASSSEKRDFLLADLGDSDGCVHEMMRLVKLQVDIRGF
jgi:hypothetical protein